ncbi:metal ABC transporter substrate-binding protein [Acetivibrio ethanolgignens]|nr:metal ABC transporter substrate-binding protein [Acetivibrio ethanolgignens]
MSKDLKKLGVLLGIMVLVIASGVLATWGVGREKVRQKDSLQVVTSFYPMYIAVMNIIDGVEGVELSNLTENQGGCLHDYQLTAADMKKLEGADVLVINGGGMEHFLERIVEVYPGLTIIDASEGIETEDDNAHYWVDPERYKKQLSNITEGLGSLDEKHRKGFVKNCEAYQAEVTRIEEKLLKAAEDFPEEKAVLFHDAFAYLAKRLGITIAYSIELEEDTSLNTGEIARIVDTVRAEGVRLLFTEKQFSDSIPAGISRETGASICVVDTLVSGEMERDAYLKGMETNIEVIAQCLQALE